MTDLTDRQKDDLQFMERTPAWPMWPCLAMKRYIEHEDGSGTRSMEAGVLWAMDFDSLEYIWFPGINMWDLEKMKSLSHEQGIPKRRDELETILNEGWMVD